MQDAKKIIALLIAAIVGIAALGFGAVACHRLSTAPGFVNRAVSEIHAAYNAGELVDKAGLGEARFPNRKEERHFFDTIAEVQRKMGRFIDSKTLRYGAVATPKSGMLVIDTIRSTYEKGSLIEVYTFQVVGEKAILVRYEVR